MPVILCNLKNSEQFTGEVREGLTSWTGMQFKIVWEIYRKGFWEADKWNTETCLRNKQLCLEAGAHEKPAAHSIEYNKTC